MPKEKSFTIRLSKAAKEFNVSFTTIQEFLAKKGFQIDSSPTTKLTEDMYVLLVKEFQGDRIVKNKADKLSDFYYKGDSITMDSTIEDKTPKRLLSTNESKDKVEMTVLLDSFSFGNNTISRKIGRLDFVLIETGISSYLNSAKSIKNISTKILVDFASQSFHFLDTSLLSDLKNLSALLEKEKEVENTQHQIDHYLKEKKKAKKLEVDIKKEKRLVKTIIKREVIEHKVFFSELQFGQERVKITFNKKNYTYRDSSIKDFDKILDLVYCSISKANKDIKTASAIKKKIQKKRIMVVIDVETKTFVFKDFDICAFVHSLIDNYLPQNNQAETNKKAPSQNTNAKQNPVTALQTMSLELSNIHFYNGYYMVFQTTNGLVDNSIAPYKIEDPDSHEILNIVHKYFEQIFEQKHIIIQHNETKIVEPSKFELLKLGNYVRLLKRNLNIKGEWWAEVQNECKPSLIHCRRFSAEEINNRVSLKNIYLDSLVSMQSEMKLIPVYEINHGKEEAAFIFSIKMPNDRCAVIFENATNNAATTTWVFVTKLENYEPCINLVFDYFTDYTFLNKRASLRAKTVNPPEKFKAEDYTFIDHDDLAQWLIKLNKILEQTPEPLEFHFVPGLNIPQSSDIRSIKTGTVVTKNLHNQLMSKLYEKLCREFGEENVSTEYRIGRKRIDVVVKFDGYCDIYEIKTATNPLDCFKQACGQLFIYSYLCRSNLKIRKRIIVGPSKASIEFEKYLSYERKKHSSQLYYMKI